MLEPPGRDKTTFERWLERWAAELPIGVIVFVVLAVGGFLWTLFSEELKPDAYLAAVATGSGLLAVGHGIRTRR